MIARAMTPDDPALQAFLQQQRAEYRASLPARLARLEAALEAWRGAATAPALHELERCAHGIAGSAATFGLPQLGAAARALEDACEQGSADVAALAGQLRDGLRQAIGPD
jgi:HPt (histidine-containing phosphotransfer) domain-containing protein